MGAALGVLALLAIWGVSMAVMGIMQYRAESDRLALIEEKAKVATASERIDAYSDDLDEVSEDLAKRMEFLEQTTQGLPDDMKSEAELSSTVTDSSSESAETIKKVSQSFPQAAELVRIEARQITLRRQQWVDRWNCSRLHLMAQSTRALNGLASALLAWKRWSAVWPAFRKSLLPAWRKPRFRQAMAIAAIPSMAAARCIQAWISKALMELPSIPQPRAK